MNKYFQVPRICAALEGRKADHQSTMVEIEGKIANIFVSVLIDPGACCGYVSPKTVEICKLKNVKHAKPWLVQLATRKKRKITELVKNCQLNMNRFQTEADWNILPLGAYDLLIHMDWLEQHHVKWDCLNKTFTCTNKQGNEKKVQGIPKKVSIRHISSLQVKKCVRKGCKLYAVNIRNLEDESEQHIESFPVLAEFQDVFLDEIHGLPPKRDLDFSIEYQDRYQSRRHLTA